MEKGIMNKNYLKKRVREKKAFTLVELVVVVAIIAILAAIAIPAVIMIINNADTSKREAEAQSMDQACKTYYMGIKSGKINANNFKATESGDKIPEFHASHDKRLSWARKCTVAGALEYSEMYGAIKDRFQDFGYDKIGTIVVYDENNSDITQLPVDGKATFNDLAYVS